MAKKKKRNPVGQSCLSCGAEMVTTTENYKYSKLIDIVLVDIPIHRCLSCGEEEAEIPRVVELHRVIAKEIAEKPSRLTPGEVRWLRTHLGYSSVDFAGVMGVTPETVSRWERLDQPKIMALPAERLLRVMARMKKPLDAYELKEMGREKSASRRITVAVQNHAWAAAV